MTESVRPRLFNLGPSWNRALAEELRQPYILELAAFVERERRGPEPVYPPKKLVFNAFGTTPYDQVKVVIVGQDPYHGPGQAHGLSFSVPRGIAPPPSLMNIFKEIQSELGIAPPKHGCLLHWAAQGVMLLNATLTVRHKTPMSHAGRGWELLTDAALSALAVREQPVIFVLWGRHAQQKCAHIPELVEAFAGNGRHQVLTAPHPSPFSAHTGFFGCGHFAEINRILASWGSAPIDWSLPE